MNKHVASVIPFRRPLEALDRSEIVKSMAEHLAAAVIADHLDLASEIDVIDTLWRAPEQWQSRVILNHLDDALLEARQILIAGEMSRAELVGIAVLFFVMGTLVGLAWNSDGAIRVSDTHSGPDDVETRSRRAF